jgi:hypothetical protein
MQDIYRRTLEASWTAYGGELNADECVEDIFAGGDGFRRDSTIGGTGSDSDETTTGNHKRHASFDRRHHFRTRSNVKGSFSKDSDIDSQPKDVYTEIDEINVREDLRSWTIHGH